MNEVDGGENTTYVSPENVNNRTNNIDASDVPGKNNDPSYDNNPFYNGNSTNTDKPDVPTNPNDRNNDNHMADDFNDDVINPGDEPADNPSDVNPGDRPRHNDDVNPGDRPRQQQDVINPGDEPIDNPSEPVENPGDDYVEDSGSNTNGNPGDQSTPNPYHYDESQHINGTRVDNGGVTEYNDGMSLPETKQDNITSNTDSGSRNTNSYGGQNSILVNTTTASPSNTGEESSASSEKSSTSSNTESVGSENPTTVNSVAKAYEILDNLVKNPQNLMLPVIIGFLVLALLYVGYRRKSKEDEY